MFQSEAFLSTMRDKMNKIRNSESFIQYNRRYENLLKEKTIAEVNRTKQINIYFLNTYDIVVMMREAVFELRQDMNGLISIELEGVDKEYVIGIVILVILVIISPIIVVLIR